MKLLITNIFFTFLYTGALNSQITFNRADTLLFEASLATSVIEGDSCYYVSGVYVDGNQDNFVIDGSYINKVDFLTGESKDLILFVDSTGQKTFDHWRNNLKKNPDGNFTVSGYKREIGKPLIPYILKFDNKGKIIYQSFLQGFTDNEFDIDADYLILKDSCILIATICERNDQGDFPATEICLFKLDIKGEILWTKKIEDFDTRDFIGEMKLAPNGNVILFGSKSLHHLDRHPLTWAQIIEIDQDGEVIKHWISETQDSLSRVQSGIIHEDGSFTIATSKSIEYYPDQFNIFNPVVISLDNNFVQQWKYYEIINMDSLYTSRLQINKIIQDENNNGTYFIGIFHFVDESNLDNQSDHVGYIVKLNAQGESEWKRYYQFYGEIDNEYHEFRDLIKTKDNGFLICGEANDHSNNSVRVSKPQRSWLIKLDEHGCLVPGCHLPVNTTTTFQEKNHLRFKALPNPIQNELNVFVYPNPSFKRATLQILDLNGKLLYSYPIQIDNLTLSIDSSNFPKGMYILSYLENGHLMQTEKIIKS